MVQGLACGFIWAGALTWAIAVAPRERRGAVVGSVIGAAIFGTLLGPLLGVFAVTVGTAPVFSVVGAISLGLALWVRLHPEPAARQTDTAPTRAPVASLIRSRGMRLGTWLIVLEAMIDRRHQRRSCRCGSRIRARRAWRSAPPSCSRRP